MSYHFNVKFVSRARGQSLIAKCAYDARACSYGGHPEIPPKANADSEGNANGVPVRRRTVLGAQRRWQLDCAGSVRVRQGKPSGAKRGTAPQTEKGARGKGRQPLSPPSAHRNPASVSSPYCASCAWNRLSSRCGGHCEPAGRGCCRRLWRRRSARASAPPEAGK